MFLIDQRELTMKSLRMLLVGLLLLAGSARSNTFGTDLTDLWWNPNESGWGVTMTHQNEVVFLTFFVYGVDNKPTWFTAQASFSGINGQGAAVFSGPMYQTSGPWFGTTFNPNGVGVRQVGIATITVFVESGSLTYSVDGVTVTKSITRQTFRTNQLSGRYLGAIVQTQSGCTNQQPNGTFEVPTAITVSNSSTTFSLVTSDGCTYSGNYAQDGRMGRSAGSYTCPGISGTYRLFEVEGSPWGITARFTASSNLCSNISGRFGGVRR